MSAAAVGWAVAGLLAGGLLAVWLTRRSYRYDDERDLPPRAVWWVPVALALGAAAVGRQFGGDVPQVVTYAVALVWMVGLAAIDVDVRRLPDRWTLPSYPVIAAALAWCTWASGEDWQRWAVALACGVGSGLAYFVLAFINPGGLGMGDVKLAVGLGMLTGWLGWPLAVLAFLAAFVVGTLVGVVVALASGAGRKATFPFGPSMLVGALVAVLLPGLLGS